VRDGFLDLLAQVPLVGGPAIRRRVCGRPKAVGQVAILVTDIVGSTELARQLGDERFVDLVARHHAVVRAEAKRARALSITPQGDGVFLVFSSVDAALAAGQAIQRAFVDWPMATRAGVHAGPAIVAEGDYYGLALNLAAHIADVATGGQILVSEASVAAAAARFRFGPPHDECVRGACEPVRLQDLLWR
jgi:class 3 adenylate cyclase